MWWTITGNFGNILPIDWSKSHAREKHMPTLQLGQRLAETPDDELNDLSSEDEAVANDLDMHALILNGLHHEDEPIKSAEEVIKEIDDIMDEATPSESDAPEVSEVMEKAKEVLGSPLYEESKWWWEMRWTHGKDQRSCARAWRWYNKFSVFRILLFGFFCFAILNDTPFQWLPSISFTELRTMTIQQLNELYLEMEVLIREFSETLISELALRDELEFEKELKNTFISLLLAVQNKRRQFHVEKKRGKTQGKPATPGKHSPLGVQYFTRIYKHKQWYLRLRNETEENKKSR